MTKRKTFYGIPPDRAEDFLNACLSKEARCQNTKNMDSKQYLNDFLEDKLVFKENTEGTGTDE